MESDAKPLIYIPYQEIHQEIDAIGVTDFKKRAYLIETNGTIYSGAGSIYKVLWYNGTHIPIFLYQNFSLFRKVSDRAYQIIAKHRPLMFRITKLLWGNDPKKVKNHWIPYLILGVLALLMLNANNRKND